MDLDKKQQQHIQDKNLSEERYNKAVEQAEVLRLLADMEKQNKFRNKKMEELERVLKQPHHTRGTIRVKMPDNLIIQGTFGALEKTQDVYTFIQ